MRVLLLTAAIYLFHPSSAIAQATPGSMSEAEVDSLRDSAYVPSERLRAYEKILDSRAHRIDELMKSRPHAGRALDLHDAIDQFAGIVDELNDNLDEYERRHRDVRKALVRLSAATDRWTAALKAPPDDEAYNTVRRIALHNTEDAHTLAQELGTKLDAYFKEHPEALAAEKKRNEAPHAPSTDGPPR